MSHVCVPPTYCCEENTRSAGCIVISTSCMIANSLQQAFFLVHDSTPVDSPRRRACGQYELSLRVLIPKEDMASSAITTLSERLLFAKEESEEMMDVIEQIGYLSCAAGNRECFRHTGAVALLASKLSSKKPLFLRNALWCLGNLIVENVSSIQGLIKDIGFVKRVIQLTRSTDKIVAESATRVIFSLTSYATPQKLLIEHQVLPALLRLIDGRSDAPTNRNATMYAAMAMTNLCYFPEPRAELWREIPRVLMSALRSECDYCRCFCVSALGNLAMRNGFYQEQIREEGGIPLLITQLRDEQNSGVPATAITECMQLHVLTAIANLSMNNDLNQREVARCDGLRTMVVLLRSTLASITQAALRAIGNTVSDVPALQDGLRASGILPLVLSMCRSPDDGIKICSLQALGHCMHGNDDVKVALQRMGALEHFGALLSNPTPIVRELAVMGMGDMCIGITDIKAIVLRESGAQMCALLEGWHAPEVQQATMRTVAMLCYNAEAQLELLEMGFMSRVCDIMQYSPLVGILEDCGKTVQMMMRSNQEMKVVSLSCGILPASISALYNGTDASHKPVLKALWHLLQNERVKTVAKGEGVCPALLHVKQSYNPAVRKLAQSVFMLFSENTEYW